MFTPPVPQNLPQRIQCHLLRGRSLRKLEMMTEALMDFNEACKLDPKDKSIGTNSNISYLSRAAIFYPDFFEFFRRSRGR